MIKIKARMDCGTKFIIKIEFQEFQKLIFPRYATTNTFKSVGSPFLHFHKRSQISHVTLEGEKLRPDGPTLFLVQRGEYTLEQYACRVIVWVLTLTMRASCYRLGDNVNITRVVLSSGFKRNQYAHCVVVWVLTLTVGTMCCRLSVFVAVMWQRQKLFEKIRLCER